MKQKRSSTSSRGHGSGVLQELSLSTRIQMIGLRKKLKKAQRAAKQHRRLLHNLIVETAVE